MKTTQNLKRVKELLLTPPTFSDNKARLQTNLDTDFLKLIAIVSMLIDHIGSVFFPEVRVLRWIGRLAFPVPILVQGVKNIQVLRLRPAVFQPAGRSFAVPSHSRQL